MARPIPPLAAPSGAYAVISSYGKIAVPVEALPYLADMLSLESSYGEGRTNYSMSSNKVELVLLSADDMNAIRVAAKLERT